MTDVFFELFNSALGPAAVAWTERGICALAFGDQESPALSSIRKDWPEASLREDRFLAREPLASFIAAPLGLWDQPLDLRGTDFQVQIWRRLREIPPGKTLHYGELANELGQPGAARAIGRACATNPIALIVPCHRVLPQSGGLGGFRWGLPLKKRLLEREGCSLPAEVPTSKVQTMSLFAGIDLFDSQADRS